MLATISGSKGGIRTHGCRDLQSLALVHSATLLLLLVLMVRIELTTSSLPRMRDYHCATSANRYAAFACMSSTSFRRSAAYDAAKACGLTKGTTLHIPLM
jgi:hypothetical protein